jgi:uncharacterized protein (UPF0332 family)
MERSVRVPQSVLSPQVREEVASRLRLADGLMATVEITSSSSEYDMRNSLSRLYYAFFHASLALLLCSGWNIDAIAKDHGKVHSAVQAKMGKYLGVFIRKLYRLRQLCDYDESMFQEEYGGGTEKVRQDFILLIRRARTNFQWLYRGSSEHLK